MVAQLCFENRPAIGWTHRRHVAAEIQAIGGQLCNINKI